VKKDGNTTILNFNDILMIRTEDNQVKIHTQN